MQPGSGLPLEISLEKPLGIDRGQPWRVLQEEGAHDFSMVQESHTSRISKRLRFDADGWGADLTIQIENRTLKPQPARLALSIHGRQAPDAPQPGFLTPGVRIWQAACHANGEMEHETHESLAKKEVSHVGQVRWAGILDKYFLLAAVPMPEKQNLRCALSAGNDGALTAAISYAERMVAPGGTETYRLRLFLGPKVLEELDAVAVEGVDAALGDAVDYGWLRPVCRPMIWLLKRLFGLAHNWGVAIILLTFVVKLLTIYPTQKSMLSMRRMAQVGPEMQKLRDKYKDQKERLNQEVMALYKRHNINPLGGCLPMLLQMPIWIALYTTISESVELYRSGFGGWITDLAAPDRFYVMPIVLGGLTFLQTRLTPNPSQDPQAKMMGYMMPVMFLMFSLFVPSGLTLYWFVNTLLSIAHQLYMNRAHPLPAAAKRP